MPSSNVFKLSAALKSFQYLFIFIISISLGCQPHDNVENVLQQYIDSRPELSVSSTIIFLPINNCQSCTNNYLNTLDEASVYSRQTHLVFHGNNKKGIQILFKDFLEKPHFSNLPQQEIIELGIGKIMNTPLNVKLDEVSKIIEIIPFLPEEFNMIWRQVQNSAKNN